MLTGVLFLVFYMFWGVLSFLAQGDTPLKDRIRGFDVFNLIPNYKLFCPNPIRCDYHLYYRCQQPDRTMTEWKEIVIGKRNLLLCFIWNPGKRDRKVFYKAVKAIRRGQGENRAAANGRVRIRGVLYVSLVNHVRYCAGKGNGGPLQFRITSRQDLHQHPREKIIYTSELHIS